jgi:hypothetical protein
MIMRRRWSALCVIGAALAAGPPPPPFAQAVQTPDARAARVEKSLLPGIVIAGRPLP